MKVMFCFCLSFLLYISSFAASIGDPDDLKIIMGNENSKGTYEYIPLKTNSENKKCFKIGKLCTSNFDCCSESCSFLDANNLYGTCVLKRIYRPKVSSFKKPQIKYLF